MNVSMSTMNRSQLKGSILLTDLRKNKPSLRAGGQAGVAHLPLWSAYAALFMEALRRGGVRNDMGLVGVSP